MTCYHPWLACRGHGEKLGRYVPFNSQWAIPGTEIWLPCGQCIGCRLQRSREWAARCVFEASRHEHNSFITLTYAPECLPEDGSLHYEHFQKFIKRLRKRLWRYEDDLKVRFFMCGEYGEQFSRPHYHAIIFGYDFPDKVFWSRNNGYPLYRSRMLEELWPFGYCTVGDVTFESAAYVARYTGTRLAPAQA